jgi:hypothetical protein
MENSFIGQHRDIQALLGTVDLLRDDLYEELCAKDAIASRCRLLEGQCDALALELQQARVVNSTFEASALEDHVQIIALNATNAGLQQQLDLTSSILYQTQIYVSSLEASLEGVGDGPVDDNPVAPPSRPSGDVSKFKREGQLRGSIKSRSNVHRWKDFALDRLSSFPADILAVTVRALHALLHPSVDDDLREQMANSYEKSAPNFTRLLPDACVMHLVQNGQQEFADSMQKHWSVGASLSIKYRCMLSRDKYNQIRHALAYTWDAEAGWDRVSYNGVNFPQLQSRHKLEKSVQQIKLATGFTKWDEGFGVAVDLRKLVVLNTIEAIRTGLFVIDEETATVKQFRGANPELMWVLDSARHHKGMKVTAAGFTFPHGTDKPMSPTNTHEFAQMECADNNEDMADMGKPALDGTFLLCFV